MGFPANQALLCALVALATITIGTSRASGQSDSQASYGQYLVVLDDSGSMDDSDPQRLAVMASMALAAVLEDGDQVMLVGLNELARGDVGGPVFRSPRELLPGRDGAAGRQELVGERPTRLGTHDGGTPCTPALERASTILNSVANAGAPQTLLMLTDGACNGGGLPTASAFLSGIRAHEDDRFRFVLLSRAGRQRPTRRLVEYSEQTGWQGDAQVAFDASALMRAFAEVLSFSRGLRFDDGGRVGLERTFAGARAVRVLAIRLAGDAAIALERVTDEPMRIDGGPTMVSDFGWSFRVANLTSSDAPYSVRSATAGAEVLVVPVYGRLRVEAVVAPCGSPPPLPWTEERAVRAGQPACAWARLVGDERETIVPGRSFEFQMQTCEDAECASASAMQPGEDGTYHAQLGDLPAGRHERTFRALGGALAAPIVERRGFASVTFGVHRVTHRSDGSRVEVLDLGRRPVAAPESIALLLEGSFPANARATVLCVVTTPGQVSDCFTCTPSSPEIALQDRVTIQLDARATPFCDAASAHGGRLPLAAELRVQPTGVASSAMQTFVLPIRAELNYAEIEPAHIEVEGGSEASATVRVPGPAALQDVEGRLEFDDQTYFEATVRTGAIRANEQGTSEVSLSVEAEECCSPGSYEGRLVLTAGDSTEHVPVTVTITDPGFWVCPGRRILRWSLAIFGVLLLIWIVRGFIAPAKFRKGATLLYADSHDALLALREGDDGWRPLERFTQTKRRFRRAATLFLGGPEAPLPSLRRVPPDGRIVAQPGAGATLIVQGPGVERFTESEGWQELSPGSYPIPGRILLKRGDLYLEFRR